jgi:hypothetical protein
MNIEDINPIHNSAQIIRNTTSTIGEIALKHEDIGTLAMLAFIEPNLQALLDHIAALEAVAEAAAGVIGGSVKMPSSPHYQLLAHRRVALLEALAALDVVGEETS